MKLKLKTRMTLVLTLLAVVPAVLTAAGVGYFLEGTISQNGLMALGVTLVAVAAVGYGLANVLAKSVLDPINYAVGCIQFIAKDIEEGKCDLTRPLEPGDNPIGARLSKAINLMTKAFADIIREVAGSSVQVSSSSEEMSGIAQQTLEGLVRQRSETEQAATAMNQMTASVQEVNQSAANGAALARQADQQTQEGTRVVQETINEIDALASNVERAAGVIHELERDSENIGSVLDVIQGIAEQTNLLALNAAIEAARAGEQGRGFAVVADEVRTLASRTQESTQEIQTIINQLQNRSKLAVSAMEDGQKQAGIGVEQAKAAGAALSAIAESVTEIDHLSTQIAAAAQEQGTVSEEINRNVVNISEVSEQNANAANQSSSASNSLSSLAGQMQTLVCSFKV